jgi:hypothetical protein
MGANLLKRKDWDDANEASLANWPKIGKAYAPISIINLKLVKYAAHMWDASVIPTRKVSEIIYDHRIEDLEKRIKKLENRITLLTSADFEESNKIVLKDISYGQAKEEIMVYFVAHHGENIDAADIQEVLNIDISLVLEILDELEHEGKIKTI